MTAVLNDLDISTAEPTEILKDNQGTIAMMRNSVGHKRTKHIDIKYHFVRSWFISVTYCSTKVMLADIFHKVSTKSSVQKTERQTWTSLTTNYEWRRSV